MATSFNGTQGVNVFGMTVLASGLRLYAKTKMIPNRSYTPTRMLKAAETYTGQTFKRGEYLKAADALTAKARELAGEVHAGKHEGSSIS